MAPWTCPECHRPFLHTNQVHSCVSIDPYAHLDDKDPNVRKTYDKLQHVVMKFGNVKISPTKSTIMFVSKSTFLAVKPKKEWLDIEFLLDKEVHEYPVHKVVRSNKSRVAHFVRLEKPKDLTAKLIALLKISYKITNEA